MACARKHCLHYGSCRARNTVAAAADGSGRPADFHTRSTRPLSTNVLVWMFRALNLEQPLHKPP
eukprot:scaffold670100_cov57-Prasinocladus_malaysianus.AAC.1